MPDSEIIVSFHYNRKDVHRTHQWLIKLISIKFFKGVNFAFNKILFNFRLNNKTSFKKKEIILYIYITTISKNVVPAERNCQNSKYSERGKDKNRIKLKNSRTI